MLTTSWTGFLVTVTGNTATATADAAADGDRVQLQLMPLLIVPLLLLPNASTVAAAWTATGKTVVDAICCIWWYGYNCQYQYIYCCC